MSPVTSSALNGNAFRCRRGRYYHNQFVLTTIWLCESLLAFQVLVEFKSAEVLTAAVAAST